MHVVCILSGEISQIWKSVSHEAPKLKDHRCHIVLSAGLPRPLTIHRSTSLSVLDSNRWCLLLYYISNVDRFRRVSSATQIEHHIICAIATVCISFSKRMRTIKCFADVIRALFDVSNRITNGGYINQATWNVTKLQKSSIDRFLTKVSWSTRFCFHFSETENKLKMRI